MNCKQVSALLEEYCHNKLTKEQVRALEAHIETCEACQQAVQVYRFFLTDAQIEQDFSPPSDLNAKIKYTISQAKKDAKIPFWRSKQTLAYITAVSFACVLGFWGSARYVQMKQALTEIPVHEVPIQADTLTETTSNGTSQPEQIALPENNKAQQSTKESPKATEQSKQSKAPSVPQKQVSPEKMTAVPTPVPSDPVKEEALQTAPQTDVAPNPSPASDEVNEAIHAEVQTEAVMPASLSDTEEVPASGGGGGSSATTSEEAPMLLRNTPALTADMLPEADLKIPLEFEEQILKKYPNHYLSEHLYSVEITKYELESEISGTVSLHPDEKTPLVLFFCTVAE